MTVDITALSVAVESELRAWYRAREGALTGQGNPAYFATEGRFVDAVLDDVVGNLVYCRRIAPEWAATFEFDPELERGGSDPLEWVGSQRVEALLKG